MDYWSPLFYSDADYAGFAVPASEGGKGTENAREVLGLEFEHHAGMRARPLQDGETPEECAYRYVRDVHTFLSDDNHGWELKKANGPDYWMSSLRVIKNEKSGYFVFKPSWVDDGPGATWFVQPFRTVTVGMIAAEIDADRRSMSEYLNEADQQRDTRRGRKRAGELRSVAVSARYRGGKAPSVRWPDHALLFGGLWEATSTDPQKEEAAA